MKNKKRIIAGFVVALALVSTSVSVFAASAYSTPAEAAAGITGKTAEEVREQRQGGATYGAIAAESGKLEEFKQAMQGIYKDALAARVADGRLTQEQADEMLAQRAARQETCDGSGNGAGCGLGMGNGGGLGLGSGHGGGLGQGSGRGMGGRGMQNGACMNG